MDPTFTLFSIAPFTSNKERQSEKERERERERESEWVSERTAKVNQISLTFDYTVLSGLLKFMVNKMSAVDSLRFVTPKWINLHNKEKPIFFLWTLWFIAEGGRSVPSKLIHQNMINIICHLLSFTAVQQIFQYHFDNLG